MKDELYEFIQDCKEKAHTARSARNKRTHNGKAGKVRLPSDYLTKKEREAMNGKVESYRMNDPISWKEFKTWPKEHQITYIKLLRQKYNAPDKAIATMMGISRPHFCKHIAQLGLSTGRGSAASKKNGSWDEDGFYAWCGMIKVAEPIDIDEWKDVNSEKNYECAIQGTADWDKHDECQSIDAYTYLDARDSDTTTDTTTTYTTDICTNPYHIMPIIPERGDMTFTNNDVEDILQTLKCVLSGVRVNMHVSWEVVTEDSIGKFKE